MHVKGFITAMIITVIFGGLSLNPVVAAESTATDFSKNYQLSLESISGQTEIISGKTAVMVFSVKNNGTEEAESVKLQAELPNKWRISQGGDETVNLKPGESKTCKITVEVPGSQVAGNQKLKISAIGQKTQSNVCEISVKVMTNPEIAYGMMGIFIVIAGFTLIQFKKFGRR